MLPEELAHLRGELVPFRVAYPLFHIGRTKAYDLAAKGQFPIPVIKIGTAGRFCRRSDIQGYFRRK